MRRLVHSTRVVSRPCNIPSVTFIPQLLISKASSSISPLALTSSLPQSTSLLDRRWKSSSSTSSVSIPTTTPVAPLSTQIRGGKYEEEFKAALTTPASYWMERARLIDWIKPPPEDQILTKDSNGIHRWFKGGQLNLSQIALDRWVERGQEDRTALIWDSPVTGQIRRYTVGELLNEVSRMAGVIKSLGITKGDRVIIYMPMIPEAVISMLACARIGAIHSVVFGGTFMMPIPVIFQSIN
jgi:hypothetical protein